MPNTVPPPSVPLTFLAAASLGLVACGATLVWAGGTGTSDPTADRVVAAAHLAVLATLSMGVLGAIHQFTPVITQRPLRSVGLARVTLISWLAASWLLPLGVAIQQEGVVEAGGALAAVAITLLVANLSAPLAVRGKGPPVTGLRFALAGFVVTACYGVVYVADRKGNWFDLSGHIVLAHAVVGLFAWLGLTYVSVAEKLWPMFFLAHVPGRHRVGWIAVWAVPSGVALLSPGLLFGLPGLAWSGAAILGAGLGAHLISLVVHIRHRRRKADLHLVFVVTSALWLLVGGGLALAGVVVMPGKYHAGVMLVASAVAALAGWILEALVGHAHKVVPFIMWSALRARGVDKNPAGKPLMFADLYDHTWAGVAYGLVTLGLIALCVGFAASLSVALGLGGGLLAVTGIVVAANLSIAPIRMLSIRKAPRPTPQ
ncbi:MAG: hypothetical protein ACRDYE_04735 [Acidimicrobiales bacterium]